MTTLWPPRTPSLRAPPGDLTQARPPSSLPGRPEEPWSDRFRSLPPASARFAFHQDTLGLLLPPGKCESFPCRGPSWHKPGPTPALRPTASSLPGGGHELTHLTELGPRQPGSSPGEEKALEKVGGQIHLSTGRGRWRGEGCVRRSRAVKKTSPQQPGRSSRGSGTSLHEDGG